MYNLHAVIITWESNKFVYRNKFSNFRKNAKKKKKIVARSFRSEVLLVKSVLKIWSKFTGEHPCRSVISIKLLCNFIEITLRHGWSPVHLLHIFRINFAKNTPGWLLLPSTRGSLIQSCQDRGPSIKHVRKIFRKTNISNPLICTRPNAYQGVRNVCPLENFAYVLDRWSLEEKGVLCGLSRMTNTLQQSNNPKVLNSKTRTRFRTEAVRYHFNKTRAVQPSMVTQFR